MANATVVQRYTHLVEGTMEAQFKDHFSATAADYNRYRPTYPPALFAWLASLTTGHDRAWDCGCGTGQAAMALVAHYRQVSATDPSRQQIAHAASHPRIKYAVAPAEDSGLPPASIDLIVVAQALHWFDFTRFYAEVRRVAKPSGVLAAISYGEITVAGAVGEILSRFYHELIGPYWPPERRFVDEHYTTIPFPFPAIDATPWEMSAEWELPHLVGYLTTWSAVREYEQRHGHSPLTLITEELTAAWGNPKSRRLIRWPLSVRVGRVTG
jgi:SAM-dependent methyltransferase